MENLHTLNDLVLFGVLLIIMLLINSLMILGINLITQGRHERLPDGSIIRKGKIGYPIRMFFEQGELLRMYFERLPFSELSDKFKAYYPHIKYQAIIPNTGRIVANEEQKVNFEVNQKAIETYLECRMSITEDITPHTWSIKFYKLVEVKKYPEALRDVLYNCPPCMSTIYGTIFYWTNMLYIFSFDFSIKLVVVWLGYWLALAYTNYKLKDK